MSTDVFPTAAAAAAAAASGAAGEEEENGFEQLHERRLGHVVAALAGFFRSISLGRGREPCLQDLLRLLTLWFRYGSEPRVEASLLEGFECVDIDMWLLVIPQIIARINSPNMRVRKSVHTLLLRVGKHHPQALIYPLAVASHEARSANALGEAQGAFPADASSRGRWAERILQSMRAHCATLVEQALLVSNELIRCAILWGEMWHEALEQAYRRYFYYEPHGIDAMLGVLLPLYRLLEAGATTANEQGFVAAYGAELQAALAHCREFSRTGQEPMLQLAWERFYAVLKQLARELQDSKTLQLASVSPQLLQARGLELAVPGTYRADREVVAIASFAPTIKVMASKQRPRRLAVMGSDGREYVFLLKGHEDLRQDERVMQLFGLVNTLLTVDASCARLDLGIQRYSVVPLSTNSGLIEWVPQCDTLHALVRDHRARRNILINVEHRLMLHYAPDLDSLSLMQKVEVFKYALAHTEGMDLYRVLWTKAPSSEAWLERRSNFSRSLAVMSMVGHMLGLGDRHPSNLMLHRYTGKLLHIDFGDCFEVAMRRDKFPETVPFRLTRMLVNAMEVSAVEGTFRSTCERVMGVLRQHRDSLMAMLEAFIHDPLIKWRLLQPQAQPPRPSREPSAARSATSQLSSRAASPNPALHGAAAGGLAGRRSPTAPSRDPSMAASRSTSRLVSRAAMRASSSTATSHGAASRPTLEPSLRASLEDALGYSDHARSAQEPAATPRSHARGRQWAAGQSSSELLASEGAGSFEPEALNERAVRVIRRVENKLTGREFGEELSVAQQVQRLIEQATSHLNLCQCYVGWCPFW